MFSKDLDFYEAAKYKSLYDSLQTTSFGVISQYICKTKGYPMKKT